MEQNQPSGAQQPHQPVQNAYAKPQQPVQNAYAKPPMPQNAPAVSSRTPPMQPAEGTVSMPTQPAKPAGQKKGLLIAAICFVSVAAIALLAVIGVGIAKRIKENQTTQVQEQKAVAFDFVSFELDLDREEAQYVNEEGIVPEENESAALQAAYDYLQQKNEKEETFESIVLHEHEVVCRVKDEPQVYHHLLNEPSYVEDEQGEVLIKQDSAENSQAEQADEADQEEAIEAEDADLVCNYGALEKVLKDYSSSYIIGNMPFVRYQNRLYFAPSEYNNIEVQYYDFETGEVRQLAYDNANEISGPGDLSTSGYVVFANPIQTDPIDGDWSQARYHVYDFAQEEMFELEPEALSSGGENMKLFCYQNGKLYGISNDSKLAVIDYKGNEAPRFYSLLEDAGDAWCISMYVCEDNVYALIRYYGEETSAVKLLKVHLESDTEATTEVIIEPDTDFVHFDGRYFYYGKDSSNGTQIKKYDIKTDSAEVMGTVDDLDFIYFIAGDRVYYHTTFNNGEDINYYDLTDESVHTVVSGQTAPMGGW